MNQYVTGTMIRSLRESRHMTQAELAEKIGVSDKAVSKWETGRGYPDITLLESLSDALGVSVIELLSGENVKNANRSANMLRSKFYVCPVCGNALFSTGEAVISCCGITLPPLEAEEALDEHEITVEAVEDEQYIKLNHPMTKSHSISFLAAVRDDGVEIARLYPEGECAARFRIGRIRRVYAYCNRHGLFALKGRF